MSWEGCLLTVLALRAVHANCLIATPQDTVSFLSLPLIRMGNSTIPQPVIDICLHLVKMSICINFTCGVDLHMISSAICAVNTDTLVIGELPLVLISHQTSYL
jgi:hypothetical protein